MEFKEIRKGLKRTQTQVAEFLGISMRTVQNYEYGGKIPHEIMKTLLKEYEKVNGVDMKNSSTSSDTNSYITKEDEMVLDKIPKEAIIAYLEKNKSEFEKIKEYNLYVLLLTKDEVIKELVSKFGQYIQHKK